MPPNRSFAARSNRSSRAVRHRARGVDFFFFWRRRICASSFSILRTSVAILVASVRPVACRRRDHPPLASRCSKCSIRILKSSSSSPFSERDNTQSAARTRLPVGALESVIMRSSVPTAIFADCCRRAIDCEKASCRAFTALAETQAFETTATT